MSEYAKIIPFLDHIESLKAGTSGIWMCRGYSWALMHQGQIDLMDFFVDMVEAYSHEVYDGDICPCLIQEDPML